MPQLVPNLNTACMSPLRRLARLCVLLPVLAMVMAGPTHLLLAHGASTGVDGEEIVSTCHGCHHCSTDQANESEESDESRDSTDGDCDTCVVIGNAKPADFDHDPELFPLLFVKHLNIFADAQVPVNRMATILARGPPTRG